MDNIRKPKQWGWLVLLTSTATLICCVIPILLVSLGLGAVAATLYATLPILTFLGLHKAWVFILTAVILALAGWALYRPGWRCPADPVQARACLTARKWNIRLFWLSLLIWGVSFLAAYLLLPLTTWLSI